MIKKSIIFATIAILAFGCSVSEQLKQAANFSKCDFRISTVENIKLAGVNVQQIESLSKLSILDAAKLSTAYLSGSLPINMLVNVDVKNPNSIKAAINKLEWVLTIDNKEMINGVTEQYVEVAPNGGSTIMPINVSFDLLNVLKGEAKESILNMGFNLVGAGNRPSRIGMKVKPSIKVGNVLIPAPAFVSINKDFGGGK
ncbi:MAG: hypothetical protein WCK02_14915 [Bacteroidota bacterium]